MCCSYLVGCSLGAFPPTLLVQGEPFGLLLVVTLAFVQPPVASKLFRLLVQFVPQSKKVFLVIALVIFALMLFMLFTTSSAPC